MRNLTRVWGTGVSWVMHSMLCVCVCVCVCVNWVSLHVAAPSAVSFPGASNDDAMIDARAHAFSCAIEEMPTTAGSGSRAAEGWRRACALNAAAAMCSRQPLSQSCPLAPSCIFQLTQRAWCNVPRPSSRPTSRSLWKAAQPDCHGRLRV